MLKLIITFTDGHVMTRRAFDFYCANDAISMRTADDIEYYNHVSRVFSL